METKEALDRLSSFRAGKDKGEVFSKTPRSSESCFRFVL